MNLTEKLDHLSNMHAKNVRDNAQRVADRQVAKAAKAAKLANAGLPTTSGTTDWNKQEAIRNVGAPNFQLNAPSPHGVAIPGAGQKNKPRK